MASLSGAGYPGIASATGTRVDSASKHIMACKVNSELLGLLCANNASREVLHSNKMKYCMHRDELVMCVNQALNNTSVISTDGYGYPSVITTLGDMGKTLKKLLLVLYQEGKTGREWLIEKNKLTDKSYVNSVAKHYGEQINNRVHMQASSMPYFEAQGYALGQAYASWLSGDTVASVLVGGMATVMNGHFECRAGQKLQWYFDFEACNFYHQSQSTGPYNVVVPAGTRKNSAMSNPDDEFVMDEATKLRKNFNDRQFGNPVSYGEESGSGPTGVKTNVFFPKPYMLREDGTEHYADKIRVFAKCINGARPHEMMDIMLCTQSL
jgi:hypothetical protein